MPKSIYKPENAVLVGLLRDARVEADLTQQGLGQALGRNQNYVSEAERAVRRLDLVQVYEWCTACGWTLQLFAKKFEAGLH